MRATDMGMFSEEVRAEIDGHLVEAKLSVNPLLFTIKSKLWVDGTLVDSKTQQTITFGCLLSGTISTGADTKTVEVFSAGSRMQTRLIIKIDGKEIAQSKR
jgi:hypothetical protein